MSDSEDSLLKSSDLRKHNSSSQTAFDWKLFLNPDQVLRKAKDDKEQVDLMLITSDGGEEIVHLSVISALSNKFLNKIDECRSSSDTTEMTLDNGTIVKKVLVEGISKKVLNALCQFAYAGQIQCREEIVDQILNCAEEFEIDRIANCCCNYYSKKLTVFNSIKLFHTGVRHNHNLKDVAWHFIRTHLVQILEKNNEFNSLSCDQLKKLLDDDKLNIGDESIVWRAISVWHSSDRDLTELLQCLRFGRMTTQALLDILNDLLIQQNQKLTEVIHNYIKMWPQFQNRDFDGYGKAVGLSPTCVRPRTPNQILFSFGGWVGGVTSCLMEVYDIRTNQWFEHQFFNNFDRAYCGIQELNGMIYIIGGTDGNDIINTVYMFDPVDIEITELAPLLENRCYVSTVTVDGLIYAIGGHNGQQRINTCERYDPKNNRWTKLSDMNISRSDASAAVFNKKIYIAGGLNEQMIENTVEFYDPTSDLWTLIHPMLSPRTSLSLICYHNSLYALGGNNGIERLQSVEKYDFASGSWQLVANMNSRRSTFSSSVLDDCIYVIGGYNGVEPISLVEKYSDTSQQWCEVASIHRGKSGYALCTVSDLPNVEQYTYNGTRFKLPQPTERIGHIDESMDVD